MIPHRTLPTLFCCIALVLSPAIAKGQVVDNKIPLNYNSHIMAHTTEAVSAAPNANADVVLYRSIADRGLYVDPADATAFGTAPLVGATGITYSLYNTLGYANTTAANAGANGLDAVFIGNRVLNNAMEALVNLGTSQGVFPSWCARAAIAGFSAAGTTVTATTAAAHGFAVGNAILIAGANPTSYNGTFTVTGVPDSTHFTFTDTNTQAAAATMFANRVVISSLSASAGTITVNTSTSHGLSAGDSVTISGVNSSATPYNGTFTVASTPTLTQFTYADAATGTASARMYFNGTTANQITALSGDVATVTATTGAAHGLSAGNSVTIAGSSVFAYNGTFTVATVPDTTHFTFATAATPLILANNFIVTSIKGDGATVTATTSAAHGFAIGSPVTIQGSSIAGYNGAFTVATVPNTTTFTIANATTGTPTASFFAAAGSCDRSTADQVTTLASPIAVDASTEIGVLYLISNGSGCQFDCVLTFNNGSTDTNVAARLEGPDWFGNPADRYIVSPYVTSQKKIGFGTPVSISSLSVVGTTATATTSAPHGMASGSSVVISGANEGGFNGVFTLTSGSGSTFTFTTPMTGTATGTPSATPLFTTFRAVATNDAAALQTFSTNNAGPNLNVTEGIISVRRIIDSGINVAGQNLTRITFRNAAWPQTNITALTGNGTLATATVGSTTGYIVGQPIQITGANPTTYNGNYTIASIISSTQFTYACAETATSSASMYANSVPISSITAGAPATGVVTVTTASAHGFAVGQAVTLSGVGTTTAYNGDALITSVPSTTTFTYSTVQTGTATASRQVARVGVGRGYSIYAVTARTGAPSNANCATPQVVSAGDTPSSNYHGTSPASPCGGGNDLASAWFRYTAGGSTPHLAEARTCQDFADPVQNPAARGVTGVTTVSAGDANVILPLDTTLTVYTGSCGSLTPVACNDDGCSVSSRVQWMATPGASYLIRVGGKNNATGRFNLHVDDPAHTDLTMPLQFNWNGICHGTTAILGPSDEQTVPPAAIANPPHVIGDVHENRSDVNGYRSIADRGMLFDAGGGAGITNALNFGGTVGYRGIVYELYDTPLQSDMVHLGNRNLAAGGARAWAIPGTQWPASGGTATTNNGLMPVWLNSDDQTGPQTSSMTGLSATFGANTRIGLLYHISNVNVNTGIVPVKATFDVTLTFSDAASVTVTVQGTDWFGGTVANPYNQILPSSGAASGVEAQRVLGIYHGTQNTDKGDDAPGAPLKICEAVISTSSLLALSNANFPTGFDPTAHGTLDSITFGNLQSGNGVVDDHIFSAVGIYAATIRDPASFNLNFPPSGTGTVNPNQLVAGSTGKFTVRVSRGSGSPNNITSVVVNASNVGLSSTLALNDSGTNGDTTPNDNIWSASFSLPVDTFPSGYVLPFTVTDAQSRTAMGNIIFSVISPAGGLTPTTVVIGNTAKATVTMSTNGSATPNITSVILDGSQLNLPNNLALNDAGTNGDTPANTGIYSRNLRVPIDVNGGNLPYQTVMSFQVTDAQAHTFFGATAVVTVNPPAVAVTPSSAFPGVLAKYTVNLGAATLITSVQADLSALFGHSPGTDLLSLNDSGNNGDTTAGDGIWSANFMVPANAGAGQVQLPYTITDSTPASYIGSTALNVSALTDLGTLTSCFLTQTGNLNSGEVQWFRFAISSPITLANFLDLDSGGSAFDTEIGLYTATGNLNASNDDTNGTQSQLSYGATTPTRPGIGTGVIPKAGQNGLLAAGTYYLALGGFDTTFGATAFAVTPGTASGAFTLHFSVGMPSGGGGPPATFVDFGTLADGTPLTNTQTLGAASVRWYRFMLATGINSANPTRSFLDIDTESSLIANTYMALYRDDGTLIAVDDDSGSGLLSQLTFGRGTRPAVFDGLPYDGRNGATLAAGTYYIGVAETPAIFGSNFNVVCLGGTNTNDVTVNIRRGVQSAIICGPMSSPIDGLTYYTLDAGFNWTDAENFAVSQLNGHLASIHNLAQVDWIRFNMISGCPGVSTTNTRAWIGLNDPTHSTVIPLCNPTCNDMRPWAWSDGTPFDYNNWAGGEPNNGPGSAAPGTEHYVEFFANGTWNDIALAGFGGGNPGDYGIIAVGPSNFPDMNCDLNVDCNDIPAFVEAAVNPAQYASDFPGCYILKGDLNGDGQVNGPDIQLFINYLFNLNAWPCP